MQSLINIIRVLQAGESLANPATWKSFQLVVNAALGVVGVLAGMRPDWGLSDDDMNTIAWGCAAAAWGLNHYLTLATSDKVGLKKKQG